MAETKHSTQGKGAEDFSFVQIRDSHIGFNKAANKNVLGTPQAAIDKVNEVPAGIKPPDFMIHTGDITQSSKPAEFGYAVQVIQSAKTGQVFYAPGDHDCSTTGSSISSGLVRARLAMAGKATITPPAKNNPD